MQTYVSMCSVSAATAKLSALRERPWSGRAISRTPGAAAPGGRSVRARGACSTAAGRWARSAVGVTLLAAALFVGAGPSFSAAAQTPSQPDQAPAVQISAALSIDADGGTCARAVSGAANTGASTGASTGANTGASTAANGNHAATSACLSRCFDNFVRDVRRCRERCMVCVEFIEGLCLVRNLDRACYADCINQAQTRHRACAARC